MSDKHSKLKSAKKIAYKIALFTAMASSLTSSEKFEPNEQPDERLKNLKNKTELLEKKIVISDEDKKTFKGFLDTLALSDAGKELINVVDTSKLTISYDSQISSTAVYCSPYHHISFAPDGDRDSNLSFFAHELTHAKQYKNGLLNRNGYTAKEFIILNRAIEADAVAQQTHITWQLKQKGITKPWEAMKNNKTYGDIFKAYEKEALKDPENINNTKAIKAAYNQWFKKAFLRNHYDKSSLKKAFSSGVEENNLLKTADYFSAEKDIFDSFKKMGQINDSTNYLISGTTSDTLTSDWYFDKMSDENKVLFDSLNVIIKKAEFTKEFGNKKPYENKRKLTAKDKKSYKLNLSPFIKPKRTKIVNASKIKNLRSR